MYLHNDIIDLTKVLKKDVPTRCVTICNDQAAGDGVRDPRADHSYRRDHSRQSGAFDLGGGWSQVPDDHDCCHADAHSRYTAGYSSADFVRGEADDGKGASIYVPLEAVINTKKRELKW